MTTTRRTLLALALLAPAAALSGCTHMYRNHGYVPTDDLLSQVVVGKTHRDELEGLLGRPGSEGVLTGSAWYYVGSRWDHYGIEQPREISRQVVAISFDANGLVSNVERFGLEKGRVVVLSRRVTDTGVSGTSTLRQLLRNIGNFNPGKMFD